MRADGVGGLGLSIKIADRFRSVDNKTIGLSAPTVEDYRNAAPSASRISGGSRPRVYNAEFPLVSIITIVRNGEATIRHCLESVIAQSYPNIEFVIGDGASTDGTLEILRHYDRSITYWHSEKDRKPEDAFNKMVPHTSGKYVTVVLADDWLAPDFVEESVRALEVSGADYAFGDVNLYDNDAFLYRRGGNPDFARTLRYEVSFNTPSWTVRRSIFDVIGLFKLVNVSPEYDWMLRAHLAGYVGIYDPKIVYNFRFGGNSSAHVYLGYKEVRAMAIANGANPLMAWVYYLRRRGMHQLRGVLEAVISNDTMLTMRRWRRSLMDRHAKARQPFR